jgi:hypothetical protein
MKSRFVSVCMIAALSLAITDSFARNPINGAQPAKSETSYKTESGDCGIPVSQFDMDINNVRARLLDAGDMWWDFSNAKYEVPKGDNKNSSVQYPQAIFAGAIWISARDVVGNLKIAAQEYRNGGNSDFYTGPLDDLGNVSQSVCNKWDRHFNVYGTEIKDIKDYVLAHPGTNITVPSKYLTENILNWPGKQNPKLIKDGYDMSGVLAPFYDNNGDGIYNPEVGDFPIIGACNANLKDKCNPFISNRDITEAYADQMVFWVMNDKGNSHTNTNGQPLGIQLNTLAFAFQSSDEINNMTFYTYNIINKSGVDYFKTYMTQFVDPDLGCSENDRIGCDTSRALGVVYNGVLGTNSCDQGTACLSGNVGYGCNLPMLGIDFFQGPIGDNGRQLGMSAFGYFSRNGGTATGDPSTAQEYRNYQEGKWKDGAPFVALGDARTGSGTAFPYAFPGDPSNASQWSECNPQVGPAIAASDRRFIQTSGPFTFKACSSQKITIGVLFVQPPGGVGSTCPSFTALSTADDKAQSLFDNCFRALEGPSAPLLDIRELEGKVIINLKSDPAGNNVGESYNQAVPGYLRSGFSVGMDTAYKFQGYLLYQLAAPTVTATDLSDPTKAQLIAEMDINDNVKQLTNWELYKDPLSGSTSWRPVTNIPSLSSKNISVNGLITLNNTGIPHSFELTTDYITSGNLINHKTYYYGVLSFATNQFRVFDPRTSLGQSQPYLVGKNFKSYTAIPHSPDEANGGRKMNSEWGTGTMVKRIEGQGNGGSFLSLTPATIEAILRDDHTDTLEYEATFDPISFRVIDPIRVKDAEFELKIFDSLPYNGVSTSKNAYWELTDKTNNVVIKSERSLDRSYEQIIQNPDTKEDYGFSLTLGTPFAIYTNKNNSQPVYGAIGGTITFKDPSKPWLSFIKDTSVQTDLSNWIRSGTNVLNCGATNQDPLCNVFVDAYNHYPATSSSGPTYLLDSNNAFDKIADGKWAPYCLAANWSLNRGTPKAGRPSTIGAPAFPWDRFDDKGSAPRNNLDKLQSVDIVITADKSKWTQCVVFETGDNPSFDDDIAGTGPVNVRRGMLRNHYSLLNKDKVVYDDGSGDIGGRSWFPGYAINVETGERLNMAFGEASDLGDQNGSDMIWNPTDQPFGKLNTGGTVPYSPLFGGRHFIYVLGSRYHGADTMGDAHIMNNFIAGYNDMVNNPISQPYKKEILAAYDEIMWTAIPYLTSGYKLASYENGLIPDGNDVTIKLRVQKPYNKYNTAATYSQAFPDSLPRYQFKTTGFAIKEGIDSIARTSLDKIRIVPNPYLAYSSYETGANDTRIKVTNLPNRCTIRIYTLDGTLVRTLDRALAIDPVSNKKIETSDGYDLGDKTGSINLENTVDWDLKNEKNIPVGSGIYLFDIDAPGVGHKILKWFGAMRPTDISNF